MKKNTSKFRYVEWKSADEMDHTTNQWISEMKFIKDEHLFFKDMLKEYTLPIIESNLFPQVKVLIDQLTTSEKKVDTLLKDVQNHKNGIEVLVDLKDEPAKERAYKEEHRNLLQEVNSFTEVYNKMKKEIFATVSQALKHLKQKRLLK
ncbi:hypothetical protein L1I30_13615 [Gillisia sp. M10.2A]|uniref:Uncharacterized protein n=1 Tax=Gillisia lutea TaxID=2909668 RepID=A0ABS9EIM3_9FLAO|nr:hypothetical protein [Gillisia lutea]MCF4102710.1 hypothetical protein [Gillisia lutea]